MRSVLICDSDPVTRRSLNVMLRGLGFHMIYEAGNGDEAVRTALDRIPDLVIMDLEIPGRDGLAVASQIRKKLHIPLIIHSACSDHNKIDTALKTGIAAFVCKPMRKQDLWPAIEMAFLHNREIETLKEQIEDLKETLESRKVIERAKGVLIESFKLSEPAAFRKMQKMAMDRRKTMRQVAEAILADRSA